VISRSTVNVAARYRDARSSGHQRSDFELKTWRSRSTSSTTRAWMRHHNLFRVLQAIELFSRRAWVRSQSDRGATHISAIKRRVLNPFAKGSVMPQRPPNTEAKVTGVCIHKTGSDSSIATMTMNQCQFVFTHLPGLLHNFAKSSVEHDLSRMVTVKINLHLSYPGSVELGANRVSLEKNIAQKTNRIGVSERGRTTFGRWIEFVVVSNGLCARSGRRFRKTSNAACSRRHASAGADVPAEPVRWSFP
jgi:hypothetical protein